MTQLAKTILTLMLITVISAVAYGKDVVIDLPRPIRGSGYKLVENWDFQSNIRDVASLRSQFFTRYIYSNSQLDHLGDELERYRDNANHIFGLDGLALTARLQGPLSSGRVESGMIRSKWAGEYGYYETRVKVPKGRGMWPAFWLNPQDGTWPPEIDILEIVNNRDDSSRYSFHFLHDGERSSGKVFSSMLDREEKYAPGDDYSDSFHTFAVEWVPGRVRHYVDDVVVVDRPFSWRHKNGIDAGNAHILMNLAVGGGWAKSPTSEAAFPAAFDVQYIRVWQK